MCTLSPHSTKQDITGIIPKFARCFTDHRDPDRTEHTLKELIAQTLYALVLGYEDLNRHDELRNDSLLALMLGKKDTIGNGRTRKRDKALTPTCQKRNT